MQRPTSGPVGGKRGSSLGGRHKRKPPKGMFINHDDLAAMASGPTGVQMLKAMEREIDSLQRHVSIPRNALFYPMTFLSILITLNTNAAAIFDSINRKLFTLI